MADVITLTYDVKKDDFTRAGEASADVKQKLKQMGVSPEAVRKVSIAMDPDLFRKTIREAANGAHRRLRQADYALQAPDHPVLWAADEMPYLKFLVFQVCDEK